MHRCHFALKTFKRWALTGDSRAREGGQAIIILAIGLIALLGFAGLVFDGGTAFAQFRRMQNAADAGAMAGVTELAKKDATTNAAVCAVVEQYAATWNGTPVYGGQTPAKVKIQYLRPNPGNGKTEAVEPPLHDPDQGINCASNTAAAPADIRALRATVTTQFNTFFLGLFGYRVGNIVAHASAEYGNVIPLHVQPIAKFCFPGGYHCGLEGTEGETVEIWQSTQIGNFGWLSFPGTNNADTLAKELDKDYNYIDQYIDNYPGSNCKKLDIGCWVQGAPGIKTSGNPHDLDGVRTALDEWIASGEPMIIILYDEESDQHGANSNYHIAGFAAFFPEWYDLDHKEMWGHFGYWVEPGQICKTCKDTGLYTVHLIPDIVEPPPDPTRKGQICVGVLDDLSGDGVIPPEERDLYVDEARITVAGGSTNTTWNSTGISINCVSGLDAGSYTVTEQNPGPTAPVPLSNDTPCTLYDCGAGGSESSRHVELAPGESETVIFLDYAPASGTIIAQAFNDGSGDGRQDSGEAFLPGAYMSLWDVTNRQVGSGYTDATGTYVFRNRPTGSYKVQGSASGYKSTTITNPVTINLTAAVTPTVRFGFQVVPAGDLCVKVFDDMNDNGTRDGTEGLVSNALITVRSPSNETWTWRTDSNEWHCFTGLPVLPFGQNYTITEANPPGYDTLVTDTESRNTIGSGRVDVVFRDRLPPKGTLCVEVFNDITGNGIWDAGEDPAVGAVVTIKEGGSTRVQFTSDASASHCFDLPPAPEHIYEVGETNAAGYYSTTADTLNSVTVNDRQTTTVKFGDRMTPLTLTPTPTRTQTPTRTLTPTVTKTPTPGPSPTPTITPVPGALCVTVFDDVNTNTLFDTTPPPPPPAPTPTVAFTPESLVAPQNVTILNSSGVTAGTWDGNGAQPHCFNGLYPGAYTAIETNQSTYKSTTADSVTAPVQSSLSTSVLFGDQFCVPRTPSQIGVILQGGSYWLKWEDVRADTYLVRGSFTSQAADNPPSEWHDVKVVSVVDYQIVLSSDGIFFYVVARNNCGSSAPSAVVALPSGSP